MSHYLFGFYLVLILIDMEVRTSRNSLSLIDGQHRPGGDHRGHRRRVYAPTIGFHPARMPFQGARRAKTDEITAEVELR